MINSHLFKPVLAVLIFLVNVNTYSQNSFAIKNVNIITMTEPNQVIPNATIVITDNKISTINGSIPKGTKILDAKGKWLMPGFIDMHVHLFTDGSISPKPPLQPHDIIVNTQDVMTPFIANGVTTVFELGSKMETFGQKSEVEKGYVIGPRIVLTYLIDGGNGKGRRANTAEEGRQFVKTAKIEGYHFIKVYDNLNIETYQAILDEAGKNGIKVIGHIPDIFQGKLKDAFVPNFGMAAHAEEFSNHSDSFKLEDAKNYAAIAKANGTWLSPTLTTMVWIANQKHTLDSIKKSPYLKYVHPLLQSRWLTANNYNKDATEEDALYYDNMVAFHFKLVNEFKKAGVPIVTGTDVGVSGVIPGFSLHDELALLVKAGLTNEEALASATQLPAKWLGIEKQLGTIEKDKIADLILLDENPLVNIGNTRKIAGVIVNGKWLDKNSLQKMMADLAQRNTANKDKYEWKKIIQKKPN
jgi:imidazolonepropionase-like amidohydrolase